MCRAFPLSTAAIHFALFDVFVSSPFLWIAITYFFYSEPFIIFAEKILSDYKQVHLGRQEDVLAVPKMEQTIHTMLRINEIAHTPMLAVLFFETVKILACFGLMIGGAARHYMSLIVLWVFLNWISIFADICVIIFPFYFHLEEAGPALAAGMGFVIIVRILGMIFMIWHAIAGPDHVDVDDDDYISGEDDREK